MATLVLASNKVPVGAGFTANSTFPNQGWYPDGFTKLDFFANGTDVVFQLMTEQGGWQDDTSQEVLGRMGFNGRDPLPRFYAVRFKVWSGTLLAASGTVDFAAYAL